MLVPQWFTLLRHFSVFISATRANKQQSHQINVCFSFIWYRSFWCTLSELIWFLIWITVLFIATHTSFTGNKDGWWSWSFSRNQNNKQKLITIIKIKGSHWNTILYVDIQIKSKVWIESFQFPTFLWNYSIYLRLHLGNAAISQIHFVPRTDHRSFLEPLSPRLW